MEGFKEFYILMESDDMTKVVKQRIKAALELLEPVKKQRNTFKVRLLRRQLLKLRSSLKGIKTVKQRNDVYKTINYIEQQIERLSKLYLPKRK